jgi:shikimate dehydrogenase
MSRLVGLIGRSLGHSVSPAFQQAAFDHLGLDVRYQVWDTREADLGLVIEGVREPAKLGANVTIPYKERALSFVDEVDEEARRIGAANTLVNRDGRLRGHNTDAGGFMRALHDLGHFDPEGRHVVVLGAGGAARAVVFSLVAAGSKSVVVLNRTLARADELAAEVGKSGTEVTALPWEDGPLESALARCHLLVNCTSVGMKDSPTEGQSPVDSRLVPGGALVYDLVYNPLETPLLKDAGRAGARTLGGLAMLVYQGAAAFELWTGLEAPVNIMMQAAKRMLAAA